VIVAAALVSLGICVIAIWIHVRRKRSKSGQLEVNAQPQPPQPQISIISDKSPSNVTVFIPNLLLLSIHRLIIQNSVPLANHNSAIESIRWFRLL